MKKCILFVFMLSMMLQTVHAAPFDLGKAVEQARTGDEMLKTVRGKYTYGNGEMESTVTYTYDHRSGRLFTRIREKRGTDTLEVIRLYNGQCTTMYTTLEENGELTYKKAVINNQSSNYPVFTPFIYSYFISRRDIADILETGTMIMPGSGIEISGLKYHETITSDGMEMVILRSSAANGASLELHLCPEYMYRPVKILHKDRDDSTIYAITSTYKEIEDGVFFPALVTEDRGRHGVITMRYAHDNPIINPPLTDNDFTIDIPEDVTVNDHRK